MVPILITFELEISRLKDELEVENRNFTNYKSFTAELAGSGNHHRMDTTLVSTVNARILDCYRIDSRAKCMLEQVFLLI